MGDLFETYADHYDDASVLEQQADSEEVAFFADLVPGTGRRVLDIGCAEGMLVVELARRGHRACGADISPRFAAAARERARGLGLAVETYVVDLEAGLGPLEGELFDDVFLNDVIEHLRNPLAALRNVRRLLGDHSRLWIHTPNCMMPARLKFYLVKPRARMNYFDPSQLGDLHLQTYDQMTLEKTLNFAGLAVTRMVPTRFTSVGVGKLGRLFKQLPRTVAAIWPHLADTLLFECRRCEPIDVEAQIHYWYSLREADGEPVSAPSR